MSYHSVMFILHPTQGLESLRYSQDPVIWFDKYDSFASQTTNTIGCPLAAFGPSDLLKPDLA